MHKYIIGDSSLQRVGEWEALCQQGETPWLNKPLISFNENVIFLSQNWNTLLWFTITNWHF